MEGKGELRDKPSQAAPFVKNHYYSGKLLHASDFVDEQRYHDGKLEFVNRHFHGYGIIRGLEAGTDREGRLVLTAGSALDEQGRIIVFPGDMTLGVRDIEGLGDFDGPDFVLGICYAEKDAGRERCFLAEEEQYRTARVVETYALKAYRLEECRYHGRRDYAHKRVLYEDDTLRMTMEMPGLVPVDSIFRIKIRITALSGRRISAGWRCTVKVQGGWFLESGGRHQRIHYKETVFEGDLLREWEICTDESRRLPVELEVGGLEIMLDGHGQARTEVFRFHIETTDNYRKAVRSTDAYADISRNRPEDTGGWLPLAHLRLERPEEGHTLFRIVDGKNIRVYAKDIWENGLLRDIMDDNGIVDIRWRHLIKRIRPLPERPSRPERPPREEVFPGGGRTPGEQAALFKSRYKEWIGELLEADRKERFRRGVAVIPIPSKYRSGQVLLSGEISHSFPGEEVLLWCGRVWEEPNYAYWDREKRVYGITQGMEDLFPKAHKSGWVIDGQALYQDVNAGTFQIALTLVKGRKRHREKEVAVSWMAVRMT